MEKRNPLLSSLANKSMKVFSYSSSRVSNLFLIDLIRFVGQTFLIRAQNYGHTIWCNRKREDTSDQSLEKNTG